MSQQELLAKVVRVLEGGGIDYMATGSVVSSLQGEPRATHDIDLVVDLSALQSEVLIKAFAGPEYYLSETSVREAIERRSMFNLLSVVEGDKVDFWLLTTDPFDRSRFGRKQTADVQGMRLNVSTPEDTILAKLRWASISGGSEKQFSDAIRVYELQYPVLDQQYLRHWAHELGIVSLLEKLTTEAEPLE
jgi:hypothetical protein